MDYMYTVVFFFFFLLYKYIDHKKKGIFSTFFFDIYIQVSVYRFKMISRYELIYYTRIL